MANDKNDKDVSLESAKEEENQKTNDKKEANDQEKKDAKTEKADEKNGDAKSEKSNHTSTTPKKEKEAAEEEGRITLGELAAVEKNLAKCKIENLQTLHTIIFGKAGTATQVRKNLRKFNGFEFDEDSDEYKEKIEEAQKNDLAKLKETAEILAISEPGSSKEDLTKSIVHFLIKPEGKTLAEEEEEKQDEVEEEEQEEEAEESEEEEVEEKPKKAVSRRSGAKDRDSKAGRPKRATAGRGYNKENFSYVDYGSSEEEEIEEAKPRIKGKRKQESEESDYNPSGGASDSDTEKKRSKFTAPTRGTRFSKRRKQDSSEEDEESEDESDDFSDDEPKKKRAKPSPKAKGRQPARNARNKKKKVSESEDEESEEEEDEEKSEEEAESEDSDKPKKGKGKAPAKKANNAKNSKGRPKRSTPAKKKKAATSDEEDDEDDKEDDKSEEESEDEPLSKKSKKSAPPTDDDIKKYLKDILSEANLEEITMKTVCKKVYAKYPQHDLTHKKEFIKQTVKSLIAT